MEIVWGGGDSIENIIYLTQIDYDYVLNVYCCDEEVMNGILLKLVPKNKILSYRLFSDLFLDGQQKMLCLCNRIKVNNPVYRGSGIDPRIQIGDFTYGTPTVYADDNSTKLEIGKFCSIALGVVIALSVDHRTDWNTTFPFNTQMPEFNWISGHPSSKGDVKIGNDVWIASGSKILSGVEIGDGAVIGANAAVTHSIPAYSIAVGNPAKISKKRFDEEIIKKLEMIRWWDWNYEDIYRVIPFLQSDDFNSLYRYWLENVQNKI